MRKKKGRIHPAANAMLFRSCVLAAGAVLGGGAAGGMTINLTYDSSVTNLGMSYANSVETATNFAAQ